ncbi:hypothetical protein U7230_12780 [Carboxydochorda subterranea]|uniref:Outer membrane protein beta-barrel domain-containing protein n=1 Tax=Carboxydichorda subterranea TaxID=3109565 RepID=A0ABZ1BXZ0_9FIRM|nr:hypothetical protein [Limnochorda sp. L945t]WRP16948.1 hypothetical protein U7230_12780 [Limnochorda sp. L945t]
MQRVAWRFGALLAGGLVAVVLLFSPAAALAQESRWDWHLSAGLGPGDPGVAVAGEVWAGVPSVDELFLRAGLTAPGGGAMVVDVGAAYLLSPLLPGLASRYPELDPYLHAAVTLRSGSGAAGSQVNFMGGGGVTYRFSERAWAWGELRVGTPVILLGAGITL